jgi:ATP diphosphatase
VSDEQSYTVADLLRVMQRLRDPETGCPWDVCQNFHTIVPSTLEECYELAHAIESEDYDEVADELGDVLFQVVFYAQMGREQNLFDFDSVVTTLVKKLLRRHPHVFADGEIEGLVHERSSVQEVKATWESIKQAERRSKQQEGVLADMPLALPALPRAQKLQKRAARVNFDWPGVSEVLVKLEEELGELRTAIDSNSQVNIAEEMGDLLFTCVNLARHLDLDAEESLRRASRKFERRFHRMEESAADDGKYLSDLNEEQLDQLWQDAKSAPPGNGRDL